MANGMPSSDKRTVFVTMLRTIDDKLTVSDKVQNFADPVLRVSVSLIFIISGAGHFFAHDEMLARVEDSPWLGIVAGIGDPSFLLWVSGIIFILAGTALALGWMCRFAALALFFTLVPITLAIHIAPGHVGPLFKNVALLGALFYIFARGPGRYALDNARPSS